MSCLYEWSGGKSQKFVRNLFTYKWQQFCKEKRLQKIKKRNKIRLYLVVAIIVLIYAIMVLYPYLKNIIKYIQMYSNKFISIYIPIGYK